MTACEAGKAGARIKVVTYEGDFNYSRLNNLGAAYATGDYVLLLNNDTQVITSGWIEELLMYAQREDVGAVGPSCITVTTPSNTRGWSLAWGPTALPGIPIINIIIWIWAIWDGFAMPRMYPRSREPVCW